MDLTVSRAARLTACFGPADGRRQWLAWGGHLVAAADHEKKLTREAVLGKSCWVDGVLRQWLTWDGYLVAAAALAFALAGVRSTRWPAEIILFLHRKMPQSHP